MGGGDLNLKKSWHPSTMKNMEKVWKAEQQDHQEKKRIAELKREIEMEKDKEDMTKYAMDQGVIEKKEDKKLDWMYKGPNQMVNREDYLLGKPIDKPFEKMVQAEKDGELNRAPKNHVEYECIPPSLRFFSGSEQVDLARKLQEDPLYAIKKKEMETKSQLLKNPVRLKQLRELLDQQSKKDKREKRSKKQKKKNRSKSSSESEDSAADLDNLLAQKYKKLKGKINEDYLIKSMKRLKKEKKKRANRKESSSSSSESSEEESEREEKKHRNVKHKRNDNGGERETRKKECKKKQSDRSTSHERTKPSKYKNNKKRRNSDASDVHEEDEDSPKKRRKNEDRERSRERSDYKNKSREIRNRSENHDRSPRRKHDVSSRDTKDSDDEKKTKSSPKVEFGLMRADRTRIENVSKPRSSRPSKSEMKEKKEEKRWIPPKRQHLTEEEKEKRRREMMENASWRDRERETNVKRYREQEKKEQPDKTYNKDFIRKQLAAAAEVGTIESRIRANINNIQRSGRAMDTNFAKR
ncbi:pre-mRNA-splicing factor CWC25 homolog [Venturia canescens]|uniref:pre-mRNA-splicing factor CWC25 homolog n=1 Tax=Venturia canescens TaxID=32260 RepID=UPI001C9BDC24|nr:pre-mRNA-splicing factor CWC25 homolog [Venturia canescens]